MTDSSLIESIRLENGNFLRLDYHQQRMDITILQLTGKENNIKLHEVLRMYSCPTDNLFKCRVVYRTAGIEKVEFIPYQVERLLQMRLVRHNQISYAYKFEDRSELDKLKPAEPQTDIIISRNGVITDAIYSNLVFFDGKKWLTPAQPLLKGTMRQALLDAGIIHEEEILENHISKFKAVKRINAMLQFDDPALPVSQIIW